jgi:hypothetical protein
MKQKSEVFNIFRKFKSLVERQSGCLIKVLREVIEGRNIPQINFINSVKMKAWKGN